jgi:cell division protein FtsB
MAKNNHKRNFFLKLFLNQYVLTILGLAVLLGISFPLARIVTQQYKIDSDVKDLEQEIAAVENKNSGLKKVINYMESDQFVEEQARLKFGLKKPGEEALSVNSQDPAKDQASKNDNNTGDKIFTSQGMDKIKVRKISNPEKWWNHFFNIHT